MRRRLKLCRTESDTQRGSLNKLFHDLQAGKLSSDSPSSNVRLRECARSAAARICTTSSSLRGALLWKQLLWIHIRHTWTWRKTGNLQISVKETNTELNYCSSWSPGEVAGPLKVTQTDTWETLTGTDRCAQQQQGFRARLECLWLSAGTLPQWDTHVGSAGASVYLLALRRVETCPDGAWVCSWEPDHSLMKLLFPKFVKQWMEVFVSPVTC